MSPSKKHMNELFALFASVKDKAEAEMLLRDMLTPQELDSLAERWQLLQLLEAGVPQREIAETLGISISKVTRGSRVMQSGKAGGAKYFLKALKSKKSADL